MNGHPGRPSCSLLAAIYFLLSALWPLRRLQPCRPPGGVATGHRPDALVPCRREAAHANLERIPLLGRQVLVDHGHCLVQRIALNETGLDEIGGTQRKMKTGHIRSSWLAVHLRPPRSLRAVIPHAVASEPSIAIPCAPLAPAVRASEILPVRSIRAHLGRASAAHSIEQHRDPVSSARVRS